MKYDPFRHRRRSIRLKGYDYSASGAYFATICINGGLCLLGEVVEGEMAAKPAGQMVKEVWEWIPDKFPAAALDAFVVMPNHVHFIVIINEVDVGVDPRVHPNYQDRPDASDDQEFRDSESWEDSESWDETGQMWVDGRAQEAGQAQEGGQAQGGEGQAQGEEGQAQGEEGRAQEAGQAQGEEGQTRGSAPTGGWVGGGDDLDSGQTWGGEGPTRGEEGQTWGGEGQTRGSAPTDVGGGKMSLSRIVQWYKSFTTAKYREGVRELDWPPFPGRLWQRNYYEHIIRNERALEAIRAYIYSNPAKWPEDQYNPTQSDRSISVENDS